MPSSSSGSATTTAGSSRGDPPGRPYYNSRCACRRASKQGRPAGSPVLVAHDPDLERDVVLITNVPIRGPHDAQMVYTEWRYRPRIEHTYRFDQERGLDVEDMQVRTLERMRRLFVLILLAALFVYFVGHTWSRSAVRWLRLLGGKLGLAKDSDGPYILLAGISAVLVSAATLAFAHAHPFPRERRTCG